MRKWSYRTQIFIALLFLVTLPNIILGIYTSSRTIQQVSSQYQQSLTAVLSQTNLTLDTLLSDIEKMGNLHLVNDDVRRALIRNYDNDQVQHMVDNRMMRTQFTQTNRLNSNIITAVYQNKHGYTFEYNFVTYKALQDTIANMEGWSELARDSDHFTYFAPILPPQGVNQKNILPMVKILKDNYSNDEIGVFCAGINFDSVSNILESSSLPGSSMAFFSKDNELLFITDSEVGQNLKLTEKMRQSSALVDKNHDMDIQSIIVDGEKYTIGTVFNKTTEWKIVGLMDNAVITDSYKQSLQRYAGIFVFNVVCGLFLAFLLSYRLTRSIKQICVELDSCKNGDLASIGRISPPSNSELRKVTDSYNHLNLRLTESLAQNYEIQLSEKQTRIRMLQFQINPHFFYNTLNLIGSIANIHDVTEIRTITEAMSEILRYNLKSGPIVRLRDELDQIQQYLSIYNIRFPNKFKHYIDAPEDLLDTPIPTFILQPVIENSLNHGLENKDIDAEMHINIYSENYDLLILISDNGVGIDASRLEELNASLQNPYQKTGESIGLINVHQRIRTFYGAGYGLQIDSDVGSGTIVTLRIPLDKSPTSMNTDNQF